MAMLQLCLKLYNMLAEANLSRTVQNIEPGAGFICTMYEFQGMDRETNTLDVVHTSDYMDVLSSMSRSDLIHGFNCLSKVCMHFGLWWRRSLPPMCCLSMRITCRSLLCK